MAELTPKVKRDILATYRHPNRREEIGEAEGGGDGEVEGGSDGESEGELTDVHTSQGRIMRRTNAPCSDLPGQARVMTRQWPDR